MKKIHVHHAIIVVNLMLVISETSNLWSHLQFKYKKSPHTVVDKKQKIINFDAKKEVKDGDSAKIENLKVVKYDSKAIRQALTSMIIRDELPFRVVEGEVFKDYFHLLEPRFVIPSRITIWRDCMKLFIEHKKLLKKYLKNERLCLTTNTWSSIQNYNYMCLTTHWIDQDWKLQKRILNFFQVPNHKGSTMGRVIESCLLDWGIEHVLTITVDNASSNDLAIACLKDQFPWRCRVLNNEFLHVSCFAHILNLVVQDGLKEHNESIIKIRNIVRYV